MKFSQSFVCFIACVAGGIVSASEIKFWTSERRSREENGERDSESFSPFSSRLRRSLVGSAAKTLFRGRLQYRQLRRLYALIPNPWRHSKVAQLSLKSEKVIFDEFVLCFDRDLSLFPFFSFLFWKGIWIFGLLQLPETGRFGRQVNGRLIGSIGEYRARFPGVDRYHLASRRMWNRRLYLY